MKLLQTFFFSTALAGSALAAPLAPGGSFVILDDVDGAGSGSAAVARPELTGAPLASVGDSGAITRDGFANGAVVQNLFQVTGGIDMAVLNGPGGSVFKLDFNIIPRNLVGESGARGYRVSGFSGWAVDVDYLRGDTLYPFTVKRSADGDDIDFLVAGDELLFDGTGSVFLSTDAPGYRLDASGAATVRVYSFGDFDLPLSGLAAPAPGSAIVPLPASGWLLGAALTGLMLRRKRR